MDSKFDFFSGRNDEMFGRLKDEIADRDVLIFGTGTGGRILSNIFKIHDIDIKFAVDNDKKKWNTSLNNINISDPGVLNGEDKYKIIIFVASMFYDDISEQLSGYGFCENIHYYDGMKLIEFLHLDQSKNLSILQGFTIWMGEGSNLHGSEYQMLAVDRETRLCHCDSLFVREDGFLLPCCRIRASEKLIIGHLSDVDLYEEIKNYDDICSCQRYKLRKIGADEKLSVNYINIEFSLLCQAQCAMCCVEAPGNGNPYKYFDELRKLINDLNPKGLIVQGGEILIQEDTMNFLKSIKSTHPNIIISLISNGNYDISKVNIVEDVFDQIYFSMVGFQTETYKRIMGLDLNKTKRFIDTLIERGKVRVGLKYLITPLNVHEAGLFLNWAIQRKPCGISIADSNIDQYINYNSWDNFWNKIFKRTALEVKKELIKNKEFLLKNNIKVGVDFNSRRIYDISDSYVQENGLNKVIDYLG